MGLGLDVESRGEACLGGEVEIGSDDMEDCGGPQIIDGAVFLGVDFGSAHDGLELSLDTGLVHN